VTLTFPGGNQCRDLLLFCLQQIGQPAPEFHPVLTVVVSLMMTTNELLLS
jgi:hypothetical protein